MKEISPNPAEKNYRRLNAFSLDQPQFENIKIIMSPKFDEAHAKPVSSTQDSLYRIQQTGIMRVGYNADVRPFVFYNDKKQLVGYDIAYAYALASALNCQIEFIPFTWKYLVQDMLANKFDVAMSAIYVSEDRLKYVSFTEPYFRSPLSMIVPKNKQNEFQNAFQVKRMKGLKIGVFDDPILIPLIKDNFPNATVVILKGISGEAPAAAFEQGEIDAIIWSQAQTNAWVLAHPNYVSVVPTGVAAPFLIAYMVQRNSTQFLRFLNYWLSLKKNDGFERSMNNQWILIRPVENTHRRWSLINSI